MVGAPKRAAFWRSFPIFEDFDDGLISLVGGIAVARSWPAGGTIFQRGDDGGFMIALASGRVRISLVTPQGRELVLRHVEPGTILGEMALLDGEARSADATAAIASEGFVISRRDFVALLEAHPAAARGVIRYLTRRLRETTDQLETIALYDLEARVARFLLTTLRQIHGDDLPADASLKLALSQTDIAGILGASRPKINRAIVSLEERGAIGRKGTIIDCNTERLLRIAEPDED
jgi:CRP-like cAMP-binding protein